MLLLIHHSRRPLGLDPVRVQKGMFLVAQEAGLPRAERYSFRPYNYGPMSVEVYRDLDGLAKKGLVRRQVADGFRWHQANTTAEGAKCASVLERTARAEAPLAERRLRRIVALLDELDFADLLTAVYERYPAYAAKSVFRR